MLCADVPLISLTHSSTFTEHNVLSIKCGKRYPMNEYSPNIAHTWLYFRQNIAHKASLPSQT